MCSRLMLAAALYVLALAPAAVRADTPVYIDQVAPLYFQQDGNNHGLLYELVEEMAKRVGNQGPITPLPLMRLRSQISLHPDALGTLWRLPELEPQYRWWFKLFDAKFYLIASARSTVDISSIEAARQLRIGVILGSPAELAARRAGFRDIQVSTNQEGIARKLDLGRIDVWLGSPRVVQAVCARIGIPIANFRMGKQIAALDLYLASAPTFNPDEAERWRLALEKMKKDGAYDAILAKYPDSFGKK
ncbi:transporter substrate-binding domain-containing protein [Pseudoduganella sp. FT55W]|uniref:Transporter substrate-binding domain-containing protein n=1 Tax=Duganella rivi TaxID=2666083 RepID=A0A7X4GMF7_9BURK|nr:ABC transporter substrate-binding protein [Duganella rivi]MYM65720.1 transporter substrate-binding domain-containing protein [Duganella rivi]